MIYVAIMGNGSASYGCSECKMTIILPRNTRTAQDSKTWERLNGRAIVTMMDHFKRTHRKAN